MTDAIVGFVIGAQLMWAVMYIVLIRGLKRNRREFREAMDRFDRESSARWNDVFARLGLRN